MYTLKINPRLCLSDAKVEALRGTWPRPSDYQVLLEENAKVEVPGEGVLARLVTNALDEELVTNSAKLLRLVHGDLSNRGNIIHKSAMMYRERVFDGGLSPTKAVVPSVLQLLKEQNARLGLTGPYSDVLGYFDATPRQPFCRPTAWSLRHPEIFEASRELVREVERVYRDELEDYWCPQWEFMRHVSPDFKYHESIFSTVTVNLNVRAAYHTDDGDFRGGMGNLIVLELGREDSGILVMPRERVAFLVRPTDVLLMNVHHLHGNLPLISGGTRLTLVLYARERIYRCR